MACEPEEWCDDKADNPPLIAALADMAFQAVLEAYYYRHALTIIREIDQYSEAALEAREHVLNGPHRAAVRRLKR